MYTIWCVIFSLIFVVSCFVIFVVNRQENSFLVWLKQDDNKYVLVDLRAEDISTGYTILIHEDHFWGHDLVTLSFEANGPGIFSTWKSDWETDNLLELQNGVEALYHEREQKEIIKKNNVAKLKETQRKQLEYTDKYAKTLTAFHKNKPKKVQ